jgi:thiol-disulfide isomerase/thioredoxin
VKVRKSLCLILGLISLCACSPRPSPEHNGLVSFLQEVTPAQTRGEGAPAPNFSWLDASGKTVSFQDYARGKPALINFWAAWFAPCRGQLPELKRISKEYAPKGVVIIGVNTHDWKDPPSLALDHLGRFTTDWKIDYPVVIEGKEFQEKPLWDAFGLRGGLPVSVLIDRQGRIVKTLMGSRTQAQFAAELDKLL